MVASEGWIIDEETLNQASTEASAVIQAMHGYTGLALTDDQREVLTELESKNRQRIALMDGVKNAMAALMADGYPEPIDTSGLAPFQQMLEEAHAAEGEKLQEMASHIDGPHEHPQQDRPVEVSEGQTHNAPVAYDHPFAKPDAPKED